MQPPRMPMVEAERLLGPAYWDEGDASWESTLTRWMDDPAQHHRPLSRDLHPIFGAAMPEPGALVGQLILRGHVHDQMYPLDGPTRHTRIHPMDREYYARWAIGAYTKVQHGQRKRIDGRMHSRVDLVAAEVTAAAQLVLWPDWSWWLWYRDETGLRLFRRLLYARSRWADATSVLDLFSRRAWAEPEVSET